MSINAQGYLDHLKSYLNLTKYGKTCLASEARNISADEIVLSEKIEGTNKRRKITLKFKGDAFAVRLDQGNDPLYHFLNNDGHLWSKRCDFVVFQCYKNSLKAFCIEFKEASTRIPSDNIMLQLKAAEAWCCSLHKIISSYTEDKKRLSLSKYVITGCQNPDPDLDNSKRYLRKYPSIRHYLFSEVDGVSLEDLENSTIKAVG